MTFISKLCITATARFESLAALAIALHLSACLTSSPKAPASQLNDLTTVNNDNRYGTEISIEQQESDPNFLSDLSQEAKALKLSEYWYQHSLSLRPSSSTGAFAALLRSAHTSLTPLSSTACANPFNSTCLELGESYRRAASEIVRSLAQSGWKIPDLNRTRYLASPESSDTLKSLNDWRFELNPARDTLRPGLGVPTSACRRSAGESTVCSPLTFLITFEQSLVAEKITARIAVIDTYQQEVITINGTTLPLASALTATFESLARSFSKSQRSTLHCLSLPTPNTATSAVILDHELAEQALSKVIAPLIADSAVRYASSICLFPIRETRQPANDAKSIAQGLRGLDRPINREPIISTKPRTLTVASFGRNSAQVATTLVQRLSRRRPKSSELRFKPRAAILVGSEQAPTDENTNPALASIKNFSLPCEQECIAALRYELLTPPSDPHTDEDRGDLGDPDAELPLSPVM
jgi:hypothetical protein